MIIEAIAEGSSVSKTREGWAATYIYQVQFDEPPGNTGAFLNASGLPVIGDSCPDLALIVATEKTLEMQDPCTARVTVQFAPRTIEKGAVQVTMTASLAQADTNKDSTGKLFPPLSTKQTDTYKGIKPATPVIPKLIPALTINARKLYELSPAEVAAVIKQAGGKRSAFALFGLSGSQGRFLCTRVSAEQLADRLYDLSYEWQYNKDEWTVQAALNDSETGMPWAKATVEDKSLSPPLYVYDEFQPDEALLPTPE